MLQELNRIRYKLKNVLAQINLFINIILWEPWKRNLQQCTQWIFFPLLLAYVYYWTPSKWFSQTSFPVSGSGTEKFTFMVRFTWYLCCFMLWLLETGLFLSVCFRKCSNGQTIRSKRIFIPFNHHLSCLSNLIKFCVFITQTDSKMVSINFFPRFGPYHDPFEIFLSYL